MNPHARKLIPSGSMVVAVVALLVAMSGSAVAASLITGEQIKDGTIQTKDISKTTRAKLAGPAGPTGERGPAGPAGRNGKDGNDGALGISHTTVRLAQAEVAPHSSGVARAHCLPGEEATGGGGDLAAAGGALDRIDRTEPTSGEEATPEGSSPDGWLARGFNDENVAQTLTAYAVCVPTGTD
jgi:hypothetical protein